MLKTTLEVPSSAKKSQWPPLHPTGLCYLKTKDRIVRFLQHSDDVEALMYSSPSEQTQLLNDHLFLLSNTGTGDTVAAAITEMAWGYQNNCSTHEQTLQPCQAKLA